MQGGPNQGCNSLAQHVGSISNNTSGTLVSTTPNVTSINTFDTSTKSDLLWLRGMAGIFAHIPGSNS
ncbi:hypothetical protein M405DRAFT_930175 [Rhizopogon salebrosus TDB-379]|nr:hypothetical protein M405DRAFT_930175 [Rhizopogon salebrosus TDB-379]